MGQCYNDLVPYIFKLHQLNFRNREFTKLTDCPNSIFRINNVLSYYTVPSDIPGNISVTVNSSNSILLSWERPPPEEENGVLLVYHVIIIETQIYYLDNGAVTTPMKAYLNTTYNVSE